MTKKGKLIEQELEKVDIESDILKGGAPRDYFDDNWRFVPKLLGERLMKAFNFKTIRNNGVYVYENGCYANNAERMIENVSCRLLGEKANSYRVSEAIKYISFNTYVNQKDINNDPNLLNLTNGLFNVTDGELIAHSPDIFMTQQLPVVYDPDATCPAIMDFLHQIVDEQDIPVLQEIVGYCLWKAYPLHKAVMLIGEGANGKSTFLNLIKSFLGKANVCSISLQDIDRNRFAGAALFGKLANIYNDVSDVALFQTGRFKMLTGGDAVTAEQKFREGFIFENYAKLLFSANKLPETRDDTDAFHRRWIFINFPAKFDGVNNNPNILKGLVIPSEMSGLFNWAIAGLNRLLEKGEFGNSKSTEAARDQYERLSSPIHAFVKDMVTINSQAEMPKDAIYGAFVQYCQENGLPAMDKAVFARRLPSVVPNVTATRLRIGKERVNCWVGLSLNDNKTTPDQAAEGKNITQYIGSDKNNKKVVRVVREKPYLKLLGDSNTLIIENCPDQTDQKNDPSHDSGSKKTKPKSGQGGQGKPAGLDKFLKEWRKHENKELTITAIKKRIGIKGLEYLLKFGAIYEPTPGRFKLI